MLWKTKRKERILIIEDEPKMRDVLRRALKEENYKTLETNNGDRALDLLNKHRDIALIVLDIHLPEMSGLEIFDRVKHEFSNVKILICSVHPKDEQEFLIWDADDYYYKSDNISIFLDKVNKLLNRK